MTQCHECTDEAELLVNVPALDGERAVCRTHLRLLANGVDARTWLLAGYASWLNENGTHPGQSLPREPRTEEEKRLRESLDEKMGWDSQEST